MRRVISLGIAGIVALACATLLAQQPGPVIPAVAIKPAPQTAVLPDLARLTPLQRSVYGGAKAGMDWLLRLNKADGRFLPGFQPALRVPLEADSYLHQASAAEAIAQASAYFRDERGAAVAKQALLTLLLETTLDPQTGARCTVAPDPFLNRLASAGLLATAIHALPSPATDLQQHADQLVHYLRLQQQATGSFKVSEEPDAPTETSQHAAGRALQAIARSHAARPDAWKAEALHKGVAFYHAWWRGHKNLPLVVAHTPAYAEAYFAVKDAAFAKAIFEMNDWLCALQYVHHDPRRPHWSGGFQSWRDGKPVATAPDLRSADAARSLAYAYRVARDAGDAARAERYRAALESCVQFLGTLQFTEANTQHFTEWYRHNFLVGAFFGSHQDGNLRLEGTAQAVAALIPYLRHTVE